jgi:hypothetical protein
MAANSKNKFPADKAGSKYAEFRNTKRISQSKVKEAAKQTAAETAGKTAGS